MAQTPGIGTPGPRPNARFGGVTKANSKGMPLTGKVKGGGLAAPNHQIGNNKMSPQGGKQGGTRLHVPGTQGPRPGARFGATQRKTKGVM